MTTPAALLTTTWIGVRSSLSFHKSILFLLASRTTSYRMLQCVILNGLIFGGSLLLLDVVLIPLLSHLFTALDLASASSSPPFAIEALRQLFTLLYLFPMLLLTLVLNTVWYQEIAEQVFKQENPNAKPQPRPLSSLIRDEIYRSVLIGFLTLESWAALNFLPAFLGVPLAFCQTSWTLAFYAYDYGWALEGWTLEKRLLFFEERWAYMLGFGAPLAVLALALPLFTGFVTYALMFPVVMILALVTPPVRNKRGWKRLGVFKAAQWAVFKLLTRLMR